MQTSTLRFGLAFLTGFGLLMAGFEACRGSTFERFMVEDVILRPTVRLINTLTPDEPATLLGRTIKAPAGPGLHVVRGCEGIEMFLLLMAAIIAFPTNLKRRVQGLLLGSLLAYVLSVSRLMALYYILRYSPDAWEALHGLILPLAPIALMTLFFLRWSPAPPTAASRRAQTHAA